MHCQVFTNTQSTWLRHECKRTSCGFVSPAKSLKWEERPQWTLSYMLQKLTNQCLSQQPMNLISLTIRLVLLLHVDTFYLEGTNGSIFQIKAWGLHSEGVKNVFNRHFVPPWALLTQPSFFIFLIILDQNSFGHLVYKSVQWLWGI